MVEELMAVRGVQVVALGELVRFLKDLGLIIQRGPPVPHLFYGATLPLPAHLVLKYHDKEV